MSQPQSKPRSSPTPHSHAAQPKTKFAFDESNPIKCGFMKKQGHAMKHFKERFYVLYPNFLVYYEDATKWQFDKTVGGLGSRKGAIKLLGASVTNTTEALSDSKFPFVVHTPDRSNKRRTYFFDTTSKEEQKSWMEAIDKATIK